MKTAMAAILALSLLGSGMAQSVAAGGSQPAATQAGMPSEATVNAFLHRMFGADPTLSFKVMDIKPSPVAGLGEVIALLSTPSGQQMMRFFVSADQQHILVGDIRPFGADPFAHDRGLLQQGAFGPARGAAKPAILLVEFSDLECPACKQAQPVIEKLVRETPAARLIFQNYPLEHIHPWARQAAAYVDCLGRESDDTAWKFIQSVYEQQDTVSEEGKATPQSVTAKLNVLASAAGADAGKLTACVASPETINRLERSRKLGGDVDVRATPTLFINGRPIPNLLSLPYEALKAVVDFEIAESRK